jgi:isopentenyl-diphosphate Delta-isomerase
MTEVTPLSSRKSDHIRINLDEDVRSSLTNGLENYHFTHRAIPELNLKDVDPTLLFFGKHLNAPILISSMTGGTAEATRINQNLAAAAQETQIAMGVGSQRIAIENPDLAPTFQIRKIAPDILLFANLGAIQLNYGFGVDECRRAVEMIEADALILHFNSLQEAIQREGQTSFAGLLHKVEEVCTRISIPVIAKEVGWGFSREDVSLLVQAGISAIDVAGAGGTSWSQVEMYRSDDDHQRQLAAAFRDWGIPTTEAILNVIQTSPGLPIIASGGLKTGVDIAKCIALGASIGGMAGPFLRSATQSPEETVKTINLIKDEIILCMFSTASNSLEQLRIDKLTKTI